jgi:hypothetical protein
MSFSRFAIAATCIGAMKRCALQMARFAARREIATGLLSEHPVFLAELGQVRARIDASEAVLDRCGALLDADEAVPVELFAVAKVAGSEFAWASADRLLQTLGGRGYDESNGVAQLLRDARVTRIFEGTTEALIAYLGQQAVNPRSDLHRLLRDTFAATDVDEVLGEAVARVRSRKALLGGPSGEDGPAPPRTWQLAGIGWSALWAVLLAAVRRRSDPDPRVVDWARMRFEQALERATSGGPDESVMVRADDVQKLGAAYAEEIGDLRQSLPGGKEEPDPLVIPEGADTDG